MSEESEEQAMGDTPDLEEEESPGRPSLEPLEEEEGGSAGHALERSGSGGH